MNNKNSAVAGVVIVCTLFILVAIIIAYHFQKENTNRALAIASLGSGHQPKSVAKVEGFAGHVQKKH